MKTTVKKVISLSVLSLAALTGCGGGGGGDGESEGTAALRIQGDFPNFAPYSEWSINTFATEDSCGDFDSGYFDLIVEYNEGANEATISLEGPDGDAVDIQVTANSDSSITLSGRIEEDGGTSTFSNLVLDFPLEEFIAQATQLSGSVDWTWEGDGETCTGKSDVSGRLVSETQPSEPTDSTTPNDPGDEVIGTATINVGNRQITLPLTSALDYQVGDQHWLTFTNIYHSDQIDDNPFDPFTVSILSVHVTPFNGTGNYTHNSEANQTVDVAVGWLDYDSLTKIDGQSCRAASDKDNEGLTPPSSTLQITQNGDNISGSGSGTLNCFDTTGDEDVYVGSRDFTISFSFEVETYRYQPQG